MNNQRLKEYLEACAELKLLLPTLKDIPPEPKTYDQWAGETGRVVMARIPAEDLGKYRLITK